MPASALVLAGFQPWSPLCSRSLGISCRTYYASGRLYPRLDSYRCGLTEVQSTEHIVDTRRGSSKAYLA